MELTGERLLPASRDRVWAALNDPEVLKRCIPGCQEIAKLSDTELTAKVGLSVGPVKATFTGRVTLSEIDAPNGYKISGEGQGGVAGFGKGSAVVKLTDDPAGTRLTYAADAAVGGKLAQIGSRLIDGAAAKIADDFFARFAERLAAPPAPHVIAEEGEVVAVGSGRAPGAQPWIRWVSLAAIAALVAYLAYRGFR